MEVQNVRRAINRYGTLPKNARIGAYLESLRQSGIGSSPNQQGSPAGGGVPVYDADEDNNGDELSTPMRLSQDEAAQLQHLIDMDIVGVSSERNMRMPGSVGGGHQRSVASRHQQSMPTEEETGSLTEERIRARDLKNKNFMIRSNSSSTGFPNDKNAVNNSGGGVPCMVGGKLGVGRAYQSSRAALGSGQTRSSKSDQRKMSGGSKMTKEAMLEFPPPPPELPPPPDDELMVMQAEAKERLSSQLSGGSSSGTRVGPSNSGRTRGPSSPKVSNNAVNNNHGNKEKPPVSPKLSVRSSSAGTQNALFDRSLQQEMELQNAAGLRWNRRVQRDEEERRMETSGERYEDAMDEFEGNFFFYFCDGPKNDAFFFPSFAVDCGNERDSALMY